MFWRFGGYANISTVDTLLEKSDVTLEELLEESDLIQELKQHNSKLIEYLRDENILGRLLDYVIAPSSDSDKDEEEVPESLSKSDDESSPGESEAKLEDQNEKKDNAKAESLSEEEREKEEKTRLKYAYVACEILSSEIWSIIEALMECQHHLRRFWSFIKRKPPLDPLQAGYFTKVNETLLDKKTEEMLEFFKSLDDIVPDMLQHVDCPMVMDLLLKIISLEKAEGGQGIVDWLQTRDLIPILLSYMSSRHSSTTQTSAGDFLKAIITISANASQNEQSCIGPNDLTRQLVSGTCIESLIREMLGGGNPLTVGVGIIIEVIRKNNSDYDPEIGNPDAPPTTQDPIYLGTLLRTFAEHVPDFMDLIVNPFHTVTLPDGTKKRERRQLKVAFGETIEPLGFDRFKTCELMAELLHCSNMGLLNERGSDRYIKERDAERERLKAEGKLQAPRKEFSNADFGEDSTSYANGESSSGMSGSPEEIRRLEVQNAADEDGFEDVAASGDLNEDVKDDFDEKPDQEEEPRPFVIELPTEPEQRPEDDDFVEEPLSPPRFESVADDAIDEPIPSLTVSVAEEKAADSPTSAGVTAKVGGLDLDKDTHMSHGETPESAPENMDSPQEPDVSPPPTQVSSEPMDQTTAPYESSQGDAVSPQSQLDHGGVPGGDGSSEQYPHPEDRPAPLFSRRSEPAVPEAEHTGTTTEPEHAMARSESQEKQDIAQGEEGSSHSVLSGGLNVPHEGDIMTDIDGRPVVGDFLKMMFVQHHVVPTILDFFFRFPWNNFLHNVVYDVVQQVFNGPMDRGYNRALAIDLFETGRITERIVEGQEKSDKSETESRMRLGYMGHLTLIAEEVVKFSERQPPELLSQSVLDKVMQQDWVNYVEHTLTETRERDNAILGGVRPDMSLGPGQGGMGGLSQGFGSGASNALANAGLNGGQGLDSVDLASGASATSGGFSTSSGSILSGFGSSSDEEDGDMEETDEEERARGSSGGSEHQLTLNTSGIELDASVTPAPLAIPPSRARRQLAKRLAQRQQESATNQANRAADGAPASTEAPSLGAPYERGAVDVADLDYSSSSSSSSDDEDDLGGSSGVGEAESGWAGSRRRLSATTEAKFRHALEEEDEEDGDGEEAEDEEGVIDLGQEGQGRGDE